MATLAGVMALGSLRAASLFQVALII